MKLSWGVLVGALLIPVSASSAQFEVGLDVGLSHETTVGSSRSTIRVPSGWLRLGIKGGRVGFETLVNAVHQRVEGGSATKIQFIPGFSWNLTPNFYSRVEIAMFQLSTPDGSSSQFGYGVAAGRRFGMGSKPYYARLEAGYTKYEENRDYFERKEWRVLFGLTLMVAGL